MGHLKPLGPLLGSPCSGKGTQPLALAGYWAGGVSGTRALPGRSPLCLQRWSWLRGSGFPRAWPRVLGISAPAKGGVLVGPLGPSAPHRSPWVVAVLHSGEAHPLRAGCPGEGQHQPLKKTPHFAEVAAAYGRGAIEQEHDVSGIKARAGHWSREEQSPPLLGTHPSPLSAAPGDERLEREPGVALIHSRPCNPAQGPGAWGPWQGPWRRETTPSRPLPVQDWWGRRVACTGVDLGLRLALAGQHGEP